MNNSPDLHIFIYLMFGALLFITTIAGTMVTYLLKKDLKCLLSHLEIDKINDTLYKEKTIDNDKILIPLSMLFLSIRKRLVFIDIILYFFGAFGLSVFLLSIKLLKSGLFDIRPGYQYTFATLFKDMDVVSSLIYILCFIIVLLYRFQISDYRSHCNILKQRIENSTIASA